MKEKISKETVIRTTVLILAIINNGLALFGKSPLPIDNDTIVNVVSFLFVTGSALISWWYNNSFSQSAILADKWKKEYLNKGED